MVEEMRKMFHMPGSRDRADLHPRAGAARPFRGDHARASTSRCRPRRPAGSWPWHRASSWSTMRRPTTSPCRWKPAAISTSTSAASAATSPTPTGWCCSWRATSSSKERHGTRCRSPRSSPGPRRWRRNKSVASPVKPGVPAISANGLPTCRRPAGQPRRFGRFPRFGAAFSRGNFRPAPAIARQACVDRPLGKRHDTILRMRARWRPVILAHRIGALEIGELGNFAPAVGVCGAGDGGRPPVETAACRTLS